MQIYSLLPLLYLPYSVRKTLRMSNINHSLVKPPMSTPGSPINVTFNFFFKSALL